MNIFVMRNQVLYYTSTNDSKYLPYPKIIFIGNILNTSN